MNKTRIKPMLVATMICAGTAITLASCDTGTSPGETNVERSEIREPSEMNTGQNSDQDTSQKMEDHYDHADHDNHDNNKAGAVHAGDGKQDGASRSKIDQ